VFLDARTAPPVAVTVPAHRGGDTRLLSSASLFRQLDSLIECPRPAATNSSGLQCGRFPPATGQRSPGRLRPDGRVLLAAAITPRNRTVAKSIVN